MIDANKIICGDCAKVLTGFPADYIDLTVTSPPYDNLRNYNGYVFDFEPIAQQLYRVTKPGGVVVWVVGDATIDGSETGTSFRQALGFMELGFNLHDTMIWMKNGVSFPESNRYYPVWEYMFVFSKGELKTTNLIDDQRNSQAGSLSKINFERTSDNKIRRPTRNNGLRQTKSKGVRWNVWMYTRNINHITDQIGRQHPAIFPEALARDHIISWSNPGDLVLDPMCGSGTVPKMCVLLDRKYIGIDISEEYCSLSKRRVAQVEAQPKLIPFESSQSSYGKIDKDKLDCQENLPLFHQQNLEME